MILPASSLFRLLVIVVAVNGIALGESVTDKLTKKLNGCNNDQVCCTPCGVVSSCSTRTCVGNPSAATTIDAGKCEELTSLAGPGLRYRHTAIDYQTPTGGGAGCAPCGSASAVMPGVDSDRLALTRHSFPDTGMISSLGMQWGFNWDVWLRCFPPGEIAQGRPTGVPGWQILVSQPAADPIDYLVAVDGAGTGEFNDRKTAFFRSLHFYDAAGALQTDPTRAVRAEYSLWTGEMFHFEIYEESPGVTLGRLLRHVDRNGNAVVASWKYAVNDPALTDSLRLNLRIRDALTDPHGRSLRFTYDESGLVQGTYVVERIDLPNGGVLRYRYAPQLDVFGGVVTSLAGVTHPDGSVSAFASSFDASISCLRVDIVDPAADRPTSRVKSVWYSTALWVDPVDPQHVEGQIFGRVRKIENALGELVFAAWQRETASADPGYAGEVRTYYLNQGRLSAVVHHGGDEITARYQRDGGLGASLTDPDDWSGWSVRALMKPGAVKLGDDEVADALGRIVRYDRDPISDVVTAVHHPDGTTERFWHNGLLQVTRHEDRLGRITTYGYDAFGNNLAHTVAVGTADEATWSWTYWVAGDAAVPGYGLPGQVRTATDANGNVTDYLYDDRGHLAAIIEPADVVGDARPTRTFAWDDAGRLHIARDAAGRTTTYGYDQRNRQVSASYDDGSSEGWVYATDGADAGLLIEHGDRNDNRTRIEYDLFGRRVREIAAFGTAVAVDQRWSYLPGNKDHVVSQAVAGDATSYAYDGRLRRVATTRWSRAGIALTETVQYDVVDRAVVQTDPYGRRTMNVHDLDNRVVRSVRELVPGGVPAGVDLAALARSDAPNPPYVIEDAGYDPQGQLRTRTDGRGTFSSIDYDGQGRVVVSSEAVGTVEVARTRRTYDRQGNIIDEINARDVVTRYAYTRRNLVATVTEAFGTAIAATTWSTYTPTGKIETRTDALLRTTRFEYGVCCDRLKQVIDPLGYRTSFTYDAVGNRLSVTDPNGNAVTTAYDARNRPEYVTNGAGETTQRIYMDDASTLASAAGLGLGADADGSAAIARDPLGALTTEIRDGLGRSIRRVDALGHATDVVYDAVVADADGALVETVSTDPLGHTIRSRADALGRVRAGVDARGEIATAAYDANGNRVRARDANGIGFDCTFDARNRDVACVDTAGSVTGRRYDANGNLVVELDALGHASYATFDERDRRILASDRIAATTRFAHDLVGNLVTITDAEGGVTRYGYDARDLLISETFPAPTGGTRRYDYDGARRIERRHDQLGVVTTYGYDAANRLRTRRYSSGAAGDDFAYDAAGRLLTARSGRYRTDVSRQYDLDGQLTEERLALDGISFPVGYAYDLDHRVTGMTYPSGSAVVRGYTARDELAEVSLAGALVARRDYDAGGRLIETAYGNGIFEKRTHMPGDDLVASIVAPVASPAPVVSFSYDYDASKRKLGEVDSAVPDGSQTFAYDDEARLTGWRRGTSTQTWDLTPVGDWAHTVRDGVAESRTHTPVHEIRTIGGAPLVHDAKGNLALQLRPLQVYAWDDENRLAAAVGIGPTGAFAATYRYDALGRRVQKRLNGEATTWITAGAQQVVELVGDPAKATWLDPHPDLSPPVTGVGPQGSLLQVDGTLHLDFRPDAAGAPEGWLADTGTVFATHGSQRCGWDRQRQAVDRKYLDQPQWDTFVRMMPAATPGTWSIALPDGSYPVVVVMGDPESRNQTNTIRIAGVEIVDPTPAEAGAFGYEMGSFDAYCVQANVTGGRLTIAPVPTRAKDPKLCFVEIGPRGGVFDDATRELVALAAQRMTAATANRRGRNAVAREVVYGTYVDEPLMMVSGGMKSYFHANHLYSVAALTDGTGAVVERYRYDAYGKRTVLAANGTTTLAGSAYGNQRSFTGLYEDAETGLLVADWRVYKPSLGRWISRDPLGYVDGLSLYAAYFVPNSTDPSGLAISDADKAAVTQIVCDNLPGKDMSSKKKEWAIRLFRDKGGEGGLVGGTPQPGEGSVGDEQFGNSTPPDGTNDPSPVGELHTHYEPVGPGQEDLSRWAAKGDKVDIVVHEENKCCKDSDKPGTGYVVYVYFWSATIPRFDKSRFINKWPRRDGSTNAEFNQQIDALSQEMEKNKVLDGYERLEICCPKK